MTSNDGWSRQKYNGLVRIFTCGGLSVHSAQRKENTDANVLCEFWSKIKFSDVFSQSLSQVKFQCIKKPSITVKRLRHEGDFKEVNENSFSETQQEKTNISGPRSNHKPLVTEGLTHEFSCKGNDICGAGCRVPRQNSSILCQCYSL